MFMTVPTPMQLIAGTTCQAETQRTSGCMPNSACRPARLSVCSDPDCQPSSDVPRCICSNMSIRSQVLTHETSSRTRQPYLVRTKLSLGVLNTSSPVLLGNGRPCCASLTWPAKHPCNFDHRHKSASHPISARTCQSPTAYTHTHTPFPCERVRL